MYYCDYNSYGKNWKPCIWPSHLSPLVASASSSTQRGLIWSRTHTIYFNRVKLSKTHLNNTIMEISFNRALITCIKLSLSLFSSNKAEVNKYFHKSYRIQKGFEVNLANECEEHKAHCDFILINIPRRAWAIKTKWFLCVWH